MRKLRAADLFCGAGGTTAGAVSSGAVDAVFALNHWDIAIKTHSANFPTAKHVNSRLDMTSPAECPKIDLLFASPECTHHSRARGGRPTSDQQRSGAWDVMKWVEFHRPSYVVIENVSEFKQWGPVGANGRPMPSKQGAFFGAWLKAIKAAGYQVEHRELNAADYGAATSRNRLFVIARKGNRSPIWPEPTHTRYPGGELPGLSLPRWKAAETVIDWNVPCPSIFSRSRPLADNTLGRLEAGLGRFVGPYVTQWDNTSVKDPSRPLTGPLATMVTKANMGLVIPMLVDVNHGESGGSRTYPLGESLGTIATHNGKALALPFQYQLIGRGSGLSRSIGQPIPTMLASRESHGVAVPWLSSFYGNATQHGIDESVATITTKDRHSLCVAVCRGPLDWPEPTTDAMRSLQATMRELGVDDLLFRMLQNHELSAAQGFDASYHFCGTKAEVTKQIGNSVSPPVARAISTAIAG